MSQNNENKSYYSSLSKAGRAVPILLLALAIFIGACLFGSGAGALGGGVKSLLLGLFAFGAYMIPVVILVHAICYASDAFHKRRGSRALFSVVAVICASVLDYAISFIGKEAVLSPAEFYASASAGGFVGSSIGYAFTALIGSVGAIILALAILAVFATFFYADRTGNFGKKVIAFRDGVSEINAGIKQKAKEAKDKNQQLKDEQDYQKREQVSEELADDDFFKARNGSDDVKISQLGIDESASPTGAATLIPHVEESIFEETEEEEIAEAKPEKPHRTKPLDLNYGIEDTDITYITNMPSQEAESAPAAESAEAKAYDNKFFGLDDSAENVFTQNFEPFNFATSEKLASKPSSKAVVQEEIDELTMLEMKGEPTEREKRMMELERKKKEWLEKKERQAPVSAPKEQTPAPEVAPQPAAEPPPSATNDSSVLETAPSVQTPAPAASYASAPAPEAAPQTATKPEPALSYAPASSPAPSHQIPSEVNAYTSYNTTETTYTRPIKTVEFTITNDPSFSFDSPKESAPVSASYPKSAPQEESAEEVAALIAEKIARSNPAYARSANEMRTYTTVISTDSDTAPASAPIAPSIPTSTDSGFTMEFGSNHPEAPKSEQSYYTFDEPATASVPENTVKSGYERAAAFASSMSEVSTPVTDPSVRYDVPTPTKSYDFDEEVSTAPDIKQSTEPTPTPEFKQFTSPAPAPAEEAAVPETIKVEREMLAPTANSYEPKPVQEVAAEAVNTPVTAAMPTQREPVNEPAEPGDFVWTEDSSEGVEVEAISENEFVAFEPEIIEEIADIDDEEDEEAITTETCPEDEPDEIEEIPPEEQNPDVIKLREMFPFLNPIGQQPPAKEESTPEPSEVEEDLPPFDEPTVVKSEPIKENLAPVPAKAEPKKPDYADYEFPSIELLAREESSTDENIQAEIQENADKLIETLASFNVTASIKGVDRGPRITRYEVVPAKGVKVSSILNLQDDIALNLAAGSIRMEAPIPGKSAVGIEIPNKKSSTVRLRNLLETEEFQSNKSKTAVCIGRDVAGQPVFGDIAKMPHLLIAGATGMGKSVSINALLISVLYKARPDEVKLIMIDPKQVEFTMYNGIPHLLVPVVSDAKQAAGALMWAVEEMERRYNLLNPLCVRNIEAYNEKVAQDRSLGEPLPKIIIVIDEFADLMLQVKDPVETLVMRIAQKARAAGIYLVIGTQRPSVNVITGVIKANVPSRISCKVMSNVDSKTVLDSAGAEKLLDRGDMLYAPAGSPKPHRVQGAFVADSEVESIMAHLKRFSDGSNYDSSVMEEIERAAQKCSKKGGGGGSDYDDGGDEVHGEGYLNDRQFLDAVEVAVNTRKISTSLIQRKLSIGYGKAAKFIDIMEDMGIVGEANGQRPREVLMTPDEWREKLARATLD